MIRLQKVASAVASLGVVTSAALGLGVQANDLEAKAAAHANLSAFVQVDDEDSLAANLDGAVDASADISDTEEDDSLDGSAGVSAAANVESDDDSAEAGLSLGADLSIED